MLIPTFEYRIIKQVKKILETKKGKKKKSRIRKVIIDCRSGDLYVRGSRETRLVFYSKRGSVSRGIIVVDPLGKRVLIFKGGSRVERQGGGVAGGSEKRHKGTAWLVPEAAGPASTR